MLIREIDGNMGKILKVYDDKCVISSSQSAKSLLFGSFMSGDKEFYYKDVTSIQFSNVGITTGYLQFEFPGARNINNISSENSFIFSATYGTAKHQELQRLMPGVADEIRGYIKKAKEVSQKSESSEADEILKFKKLLDAGIITQEEFEAKKRQLLGL